VLALFDALAIDRAVIGGASMGCATSIYAALRAPERVDRLVLAIPSTAWATRRLQQRFYESGAAAAAVTGLRALVAIMRARPVPRVIAERYPQWRDRGVEHVLRVDRATFAAILGGAGHSDFPSPADLATLVMPALILAWHGDPVHPVETAKKPRGDPPERPPCTRRMSGATWRRGSRSCARSCPPDRHDARRSLRRGPRLASPRSPRQGSRTVTPR
jgi:3-oxoadipate enol-lactonase